MGQSEKILGLFDTILGKFKFFRDYIKILLRMDERLDNLTDSENKHDKQIQEIKESLADLTEKLESIAEHVESIAKLDRELLPKNPRDLMTDIYNKYNKDEY